MVDIFDNLSFDLFEFNHPIKHTYKESFHVKSRTQKMNHFRLFSYFVHKVYIL